MKQTILMILFYSGLFWTLPVSSASEQQLQSISTMGQLNGVALQCKYFDQMRRIKMALIQNLPKERALGMRFEEATNTSFMGFMEKQESCPDSQSFAGQVDEAINQLKNEFAK